MVSLRQRLAEIDPMTIGAASTSLWDLMTCSSCEPVIDPTLDDDNEESNDEEGVKEKHEEGLEGYQSEDSTDSIIAPPAAAAPTINEVQAITKSIKARQTVKSLKTIRTTNLPKVEGSLRSAPQVSSAATKKGPELPRAKLTEDELREIRENYNLLPSRAFGDPAKPKDPTIAKPIMLTWPEFDALVALRSSKGGHIPFTHAYREETENGEIDALSKKYMEMRAKKLRVSKEGKRVISL